jgi:large subunit ribosomal protein L19e
MELNQIKKLAAKVFGVGIDRVKIIDKEKADQAMTREDVRSLVKQGKIEIKQKKGVSRVRARKIAIQKKKGRKKGSGKRKGGTKARTPKKKDWMKKVRALRKKLREIKPTMETGSYRRLYNMVKGGYFRNKSHLMLYVKEKELVKK